MPHRRILALSLLGSFLVASCGLAPAETRTPLRASTTLRSLDTTPDITNFKQVDAGLYRGALPEEKGLTQLKALGIKTVVNLMGAGDPREHSYGREEQAVAQRLGMQYVNVVIPFKGLIPDTVVDRFLEVAEDPRQRPVYVHCLHGRDRTGTMVATYRMHHDHYTFDQAFDEMRSFGFKPEKYPRFVEFLKHYGTEPVAR